MRVFTQMDIDKIKSKLIILDNGCWDYSGTKDKDGYSIIWFDGKNYKMHRVMYYLKHNYIDETLQVAHLCNNRYCCNPDHLIQQTHQENIQYRCDCNRTARQYSERNDRAKRTKQEIIHILDDIWNNEFNNLQEISNKHKIPKTLLRNILYGKNWIEVTDSYPIPLIDIRHKIRSFR